MGRIGSPSESTPRNLSPLGVFILRSPGGGLRLSQVNELGRGGGEIVAPFAAEFKVPSVVCRYSWQRALLPLITAAPCDKEDDA